MAIVDDSVPVAKGPSLIVQIAIVAAMTVAAIGIGWVSGLYLTGGRQHVSSSGGHGAAKAEEARLADAQEAMGVVYLEPITTNMAGPADTRVRIELALVFDGPIDMMVAQTVHQDILAYMRTVKIHQVEGASGFQHLRSDLEERAAIRSDSKVKGILIRTLLFE